jgi:hypothetical protein
LRGVDGDRGRVRRDFPTACRLAGGYETYSRTLVILVDTNVFVIDLRFRRDPLYRLNRRFLDRLLKDGSGATTLFNHRLYRASY